jgi:hypothetical protein
MLGQHLDLTTTASVSIFSDWLFTLTLSLMELSPSEKLIIVQLLKNFSGFYGTRRFITVFTRAFHWSLSSATSIQFMPSYPFSIVRPPTFCSSQWSLSFLLSHQYSICIPLFPHSCYMPCPSHSPWFHHSSYTWVKSTSYGVPHYAVFFSLLSLHLSSAQIFSSAPCSQTPSSLNVRDQVSHPYRSRRKIVVLRILIFTFLDSRREDECFNI